MKVLITGVSGFLGRHFKKRYEELGWEVFGIDITYNRLGMFNYLWMDARNFFRRTPVEYNFPGKFDQVIHCAAVVGGRKVTDGDPLAQSVNLELDAGLFRWALATKQPHVTYISSSAVYPVGLQDFESMSRLSEWHACEPAGGHAGRPDALYGWSKLTGEYLALLARQKGLQVTIVRPFSGYGSDQADDYPFPAFIRRARASADPFEVWGHPRQVRDFIHVSDIVKGTMAVADAKMAAPVNLCTGIPTEMLTLAQKVCAEAGYQPMVRPDIDAPMGVQYRVGDPSLMEQFYKPQVTLEMGIAQTFIELDAQ